ncbi:flocculin [Planoprotostelium fungivorum]|uniref:Flocculin n=1 Tax=Planoprotostelium fungivorum TaxID=1890364 RepID=A0A2P6NWI9_9EUKA|nr:flocculin [Planoprotostelium fungivorum]
MAHAGTHLRLFVCTLLVQFCTSHITCSGGVAQLSSEDGTCLTVNLGDTATRLSTCNDTRDLWHVDLTWRRLYNDNTTSREWSFFFYTATNLTTTCHSILPNGSLSTPQSSNVSAHRIIQSIQSNQGNMSIDIVYTLYYHSRNLTNFWAGQDHKEFGPNHFETDIIVYNWKNQTKTSTLHMEVGAITSMGMLDLSSISDDNGNYRGLSFLKGSLYLSQMSTVVAGDKTTHPPSYFDYILQHLTPPTATAGVQLAEASNDANVTWSIVLEMNKPGIPQWTTTIIAISAGVVLFLLLSGEERRRRGRTECYNPSGLLLSLMLVTSREGTLSLKTKILLETQEQINIFGYHNDGPSIWQNLWSPSGTERPNILARAGRTSAASLEATSQEFTVGTQQPSLAHWTMMDRNTWTKQRMNLSDTDLEAILRQIIQQQKSRLQAITYRDLAIEMESRLNWPPNILLHDMQRIKLFADRIIDQLTKVEHFSYPQNSYSEASTYHSNHFQESQNFHGAMHNPNFHPLQNTHLPHSTPLQPPSHISFPHLNGLIHNPQGGLFHHNETAHRTPAAYRAFEDFSGPIQDHKHRPLDAEGVNFLNRFQSLDLSLGSAISAQMREASIYNQAQALEEDHDDDTVESPKSLLGSIIDDIGLVEALEWTEEEKENPSNLQLSLSGSSLWHNSMMDSLFSNHSTTSHTDNEASEDVWAPASIYNASPPHSHVTSDDVIFIQSPVSTREVHENNLMRSTVLPPLSDEATYDFREEDYTETNSSLMNSVNSYSDHDESKTMNGLSRSVSSTSISSFGDTEHSSSHENSSQWEEEKRSIVKMDLKLDGNEHKHRGTSYNRVPLDYQWYNPPAEEEEKNKSSPNVRNNGDDHRGSMRRALSFGRNEEKNGKKTPPMLSRTTMSVSTPSLFGFARDNKPPRHLSPTATSQKVKKGGHVAKAASFGSHHKAIVVDRGWDVDRSRGYNMLVHLGWSSGKSIGKNPNLPITTLASVTKYKVKVDREGINENRDKKEEPTEDQGVNSWEMMTSSTELAGSTDSKSEWFDSPTDKLNDDPSTTIPSEEEMGLRDATTSPSSSTTRQKEVVPVPETKPAYVPTTLVNHWEELSSAPTSPRDSPDISYRPHDVQKSDRKEVSVADTLAEQKRQEEEDITTLLDRLVKIDDEWKKEMSKMKRMAANREDKGRKSVLEDFVRRCALSLENLRCPRPGD